jgi:hypothetical protein
MEKRKISLLIRGNLYVSGDIAANTDLGSDVLFFVDPDSLRDNYDMSHTVELCGDTTVDGDALANHSGIIAVTGDGLSGAPNLKDMFNK